MTISYVVNRKQNGPDLRKLFLQFISQKWPASLKYSINMAILMNLFHNIQYLYPHHMGFTTPRLVYHLIYVYKFWLLIIQKNYVFSLSSTWDFAFPSISTFLDLHLIGRTDVRKNSWQGYLLMGSRHFKKKDIVKKLCVWLFAWKYLRKNGAGKQIKRREQLPVQSHILNNTNEFSASKFVPAGCQNKDHLHQESGNRKKGTHRFKIVIRMKSWKNIYLDVGTLMSDARTSSVFIQLNNLPL